jgi:hypothetical protein
MKSNRMKQAANRVLFVLSAMVGLAAGNVASAQPCALSISPPNNTA